jgi:hypothetical protein
MRRAKSAPSISTRNAAADEMFLQPRMSALGQKLTLALQKGMSALPLIGTAKADSRKKRKRTPAKSHVRFTPESRHWHCTKQCLLRAKSGHAPLRKSSRAQPIQISFH